MINPKPDSDQFKEVMSDSDEQLLTAIEMVRMSHQKPTLERIYTRYKKVSTHCQHLSSASSLQTVIDDAIQRKLIIRLEGKDSNGVSYKVVNRLAKRRFTSNVFESNSNDSDLKEDNSSAKRIRLSKEKRRVEETDETSGSFSPVMSSHSGLESVAIDEYCDIDDIDGSDSHVSADSGVDPRVFDLTGDAIDSSPTSMSFKSTPIKSFNHMINVHPIRKRAIGCASSTSSSCGTNEGIGLKLWPNDLQNWLTEELPRFWPFIAQKGDRVVYLRDAHRIYIESETRELRKENPIFGCTEGHISAAIKTNDYIVSALITDVKFFQINCIQFSVICLKNMSKENAFEWKVLYRPKRGICDFLVLQQFYNDPQNDKWVPGSEFRSLWRKAWWMGRVVKKSVFDKKYPNSLFKCFEVQWNTGEEGRLSPWDLFPIDPTRVPKRKENGKAVTREDLIANSYKPQFNEWPEALGYEPGLWRCYESKRIYDGIKCIEKHIPKRIISLFKECKHPAIAYPVTLPLIKERLKNMFYRRKDSVVSDIYYLKTVSKLCLNKSDFKIAEQFVDLIVSIAKDNESCNDEQYSLHLNQYKQLTQTESETAGANTSTDSSCTDHSNSSQIQHWRPSIPSIPKRPNPSNIKPKSKSHKKKPPKPSSTANSVRRSSEPTPKPMEKEKTENTQWKTDSQKFIEDLLKKDESLPYRQPVDPLLFPTYRIVIKNPIDLSEIQEKLEKDFYTNPKELRQDLRLMYENAKVFAKDAKPLLRVNNKMLYKWSEDRLREIIVEWQRVYDYEVKQRTRNGYKAREQPIARNQLWGYGAQQYY